MRVDIETVSPLTAGQTVVDIYRQSPLPANVFVAKVRARLGFLVVSGLQIRN
jgi:inosine-uridine nucleoside N-ribohydrolase